MEKCLWSSKEDLCQHRVVLGATRHGMSQQVAHLGAYDDSRVCIVDKERAGEGFVFVDGMPDRQQFAEAENAKDRFTDFKK